MLYKVKSILAIIIAITTLHILEITVLDAMFITAVLLRIHAKLACEITLPFIIIKPAIYTAAKTTTIKLVIKNILFIPKTPGVTVYIFKKGLDRKQVIKFHIHTKIELFLLLISGLVSAVTDTAPIKSSIDAICFKVISSPKRAAPKNVDPIIFPDIPIMELKGIDTFDRDITPIAKEFITIRAYITENRNVTQLISIRNLQRIKKHKVPKNAFIRLYIIIVDRLLLIPN